VKADGIRAIFHRSKSVEAGSEGGTGGIRIEENRHDAPTKNWIAAAGMEGTTPRDGRRISPGYAFFAPTVFCA
jgi:hypothetical protein